MTVSRVGRALWFALAGCVIRPPVVVPQPTCCLSATTASGAPSVVARVEVCGRIPATASDDDDDAWFLDDDTASSTTDTDDTMSSPSDVTRPAPAMDDGDDLDLSDD